MGHVDSMRRTLKAQALFLSECSSEVRSRNQLCQSGGVWLWPVCPTNLYDTTRKELIARIEQTPSPGSGGRDKNRKRDLGPHSYTVCSSISSACPFAHKCATRHVDSMRRTLKAQALFLSECSSEVRSRNQLCQSGGVWLWPVCPKSQPPRRNVTPMLSCLLKRENQM